MARIPLVMAFRCRQVMARALGWAGVPKMGGERDEALNDLHVVDVKLTHVLPMAPLVAPPVTANTCGE